MALNPGDVEMTALSCGDCGYSIVPRAAFLRVAHCPRCLAKRRVAVPLRESAEPVRRTAFGRSRPAQDGQGI